MQTQKMSLANIQGKLSRAEMKNIMAGSGAAGGCCASDSNCGGNAPYCNKGQSCNCGNGPGPGCCTA